MNALSVSARLPDLERLKLCERDCERLADMLTLFHALSDSFLLADIERERLCDCEAAMLSLDQLMDFDLLMLMLRL